MQKQENNILVLNKSYMPIGRTDFQRAIILIILDKAKSIKDSDTEINSPNFSIKIPEAIVLTDCNIFLKSTEGKPTKKKIFQRDGNRCQYCFDSRKEKLTIDHIYPQSRFEELKKKYNLDYDKNSFENVVTCCKDCNLRKDNKTLEELGWPQVKPRSYNGLNFDWEKLFDMGIT
jgi:5-methylcytosine-specific restriction endonuclease McrA